LTRYVLDCSVTMAWCFQDESDAYAERALEIAEDRGVVVPSLWPIEVMNTLVVGERRNRGTREESQEFISLLNDLDIQIDNGRSWPGHEHLLSLAREAGASVYDATYLDVSLRHNLPLATNDNRLKKAAQKVKVKLLMV